MIRSATFALALAACSSPSRPAAPPPPPPARALDAAPPPDAAAPDARAVPDGLVDVAVAVPEAVLDLRYATNRNLTGAPLYPVARCLLDARVAARLADAATALAVDGYRLVLWDCYRPFAIQEVLWDRVRDPRYAAEPVRDRRGRPVRGSVHSRAAAVDVSLADAAGASLAMPTDHDDFTRAAHRSRRAADPAVRRRMAALDAAMTGAGFVGLATEWWHYDAPEGHGLPLRDDPL